MRRKLDFIPKQHGWHFPNNLSTEILGPIKTYGLCGGMCISALNYKRHGIKIPALTWGDIPITSKFTENGNELVRIPVLNPGEPHPVFQYIFHSQMASFQTSNIVKQFVFFLIDSDQNHFAWSVNDEFPLIKQAIDANCYATIGLRNPKAGDVTGHQCLVYGYDDDRKTLFMYDPNVPDKECVVFSTGTGLEFGYYEDDGSYHRYGNESQYRSYYLQLTLEPARTSTEITYDVLRNKRDNFAVRPTYADPVFVSPAGIASALATERVIATPARRRR